MKALKMKSVCKDYIWGGTLLNEKYKKNSGFEKTAESWELSVHPDGESRVCGGEYDQKTLREIIKENPEILGTARKSDELPILIKLIDAADDLSVQVHPNDAQAREWENQNGKTEMWYVVETKPGAKIICGVNEDTTKEALKKAVEDNTVEKLLCAHDPKEGDVFFVEAGTVHAIGKGNLIAEIQQNSNVTYRLYDYDRKDKNGNTRPLHIEKGVLAANTKKTPKREIPKCSDNMRLLGSCKYFSVRELDTNAVQRLVCRNESYTALVCVFGAAKLNNEDEEIAISCGETVFIPAGDKAYDIEGAAKLLVVTNPPRYFVGIDLGGTNIATAVVDEYGIIYGRGHRKTNAPRPYEELFSDMAAAALDAVKNSGLKLSDIESVGVGCPGSLDREEGKIIYSNNLFIKDAPISKALSEALGKKIYIENDANAAAWGEFLAGAGAKYDSMVMITLGTGVGSGIVIGGKLMRGAYENGAEIGHMTIAMDGVECTCQNKGCFEAYASATALIRQTKEAMEKNPESKMWQTVGGDIEKVDGKTAFYTDDAAAREVVETYLNYLGVGIINVVNILQPEIVCIGGGVSNAGDRVAMPVNKMIKERSYARFGKKQSVAKIAKLNNDAGIIGAALLWKS